MRYLLVKYFVVQVAAFNLMLQSDLPSVVRGLSSVVRRHQHHHNIKTKT